MNIKKLNTEENINVEESFEELFLKENDDKFARFLALFSREKFLSLNTRRNNC